MTDKIKVTLTLLIETVEFEPPDFDSEEEQEEDEESEDEGNKLEKKCFLNPSKNQYHQSVFFIVAVGFLQTFWWGFLHPMIISSIAMMYVINWILIIPRGKKIGVWMFI